MGADDILVEGIRSQMDRIPEESKDLNLQNASGLLSAAHRQLSSGEVRMSVSSLTQAIAFLLNSALQKENED